MGAKSEPPQIKSRYNSRKEDKSEMALSSLSLIGDFMSRRKAKAKLTKLSVAQKNHLELRDIQPLTNTQSAVYRAYDQGKNLFLHGYAGTGKSFLSLFLALDEIDETRAYESVLMIRSIVSSRDPGFLPGSIKEKQAVYEEPYLEILGELYGRGDAARLLRDKGAYDFTTTSFLRGHTFRNKIVIVDEVQNMSWTELYTVLSRVGEGSRVILCGDLRQTDLKKNESGLGHMMNVLKSMHNMEVIEFQQEDIVRSAFVKELIIKSTEYQDRLGHAL